MAMGLLVCSVVAGTAAAGVALMTGMGVLVALLAYSGGGVAGLLLGLVLAATAPDPQPLARRKRAL